MPLVARQDLKLAVSQQSESAPLQPITTPTWIRLPLTDVRLNLDQLESRDNAGRIGAGDEFPTESRALRWTHELTLTFEGHVEGLAYFINRFMGIVNNASVGTPATHRTSSPSFINPSTGGRTPNLFEVLIDDGIEKRRLISCAVQRVRIAVPELDRVTAEVNIVALDNVDGSAQTMPASEATVNYVYAHADNTVFTVLGINEIASRRLRSFELVFEQEIPRDVQYVIGGGFRTTGQIESGAKPSRMIFANRRVTASFVALYEGTEEISKIRDQSAGSLSATFKGGSISGASPAADYEFSLNAPKVKFASRTFETVGDIVAIGVGMSLLKAGAAPVSVSFNFDKDFLFS